MADDPMEALIRQALTEQGFAFTEDGKPGGEVNKALDFHLSDYAVHIEVKQFHSPRIAAQTARVPDVIVAQGRGAVALLAELLRGRVSGRKAPNSGAIHDQTKPTTPDSDL